MALQVKDGKRERVYGCYLVLSSTPSGTACHRPPYCLRRHRHLTVHNLLYLTGCTMFAHIVVHDLVGCTVFVRDGKRRSPQYCLCSDVSGRLYSVRLTWPGGTVLQVRRAWQGTVLGITVDFERLTLSALPDPRALTKRTSPVGRSQSVPTVSVGKEQRAEVWRILDRRRGRSLSVF